MRAVFLTCRPLAALFPPCVLVPGLSRVSIARSSTWLVYCQHRNVRPDISAWCPTAQDSGCEALQLEVDSVCHVRVAEFERVLLLFRGIGHNDKGDAAI